MSDLTPRTDPIRPGQPAPGFTLKDQNRNDWTLADQVRKGPVVLCFYPMDFSSVCTVEMRCVTDEFARWSDAGATVVGVSCDSFFVHEAWAKAEGLKQPLLADMHREVCKAYGFYWPELNVASRGTVVIAQSDDGRGTVAWAQHREIKDAMNIEEVLGALS